MADRRLTLLFKAAFSTLLAQSTAEAELFQIASYSFTALGGLFTGRVA
jgi:hypothetical protein